MTHRLPAVAALLAGLLSIVEGVAQLGYSQPASGWGPIDLLFELGFAVALAASGVAVRGLPDRLGSGRVAQIGAVVAQVGFGVLLLTSIASAVARRNALDFVFPLGLLLVLIGLLTLAIAGAVTGQPRWVAPLPFIGFLLSVALPIAAVGDTLLGITWLIVGALMTARPRTVTALA